MADERIYITEVKEGDVCPFEEKCEGFYKLCEGCNVLPTRQEVIYKMAKAIFTQKWGLPNNRFDLAKSSVKVRNRKLAEAALNALLEEQK